MNLVRPFALAPIAVAASLALGGCSDDRVDDVATTLPVADVPGVVLENFTAAAFGADATTEECTLGGGTTTTCYRLTIAGEPTGTAVGPFCPESITSTREDGGLWFDGSGTLYDVDGDFIVGLSNIYDDPRWMMYDEATGLVNVTDGQAGCDVTGDPNVDPDFTNECVECTLETLGGGVEKTVLIPIVPVPADLPGDIGRSDVGVALNGVALGPPAPIELILGSYTLGVFDDCGGHVNPHEGYHYHGSTGCSETGVQDDGHAPLLGYAMDGYGIYALADADGDESTGLDECRGMTDDVRGYHYHTAAAAENAFIDCFHGETGSVVGDDGGGGPGGPPPEGRPPEGRPPGGRPPEGAPGGG